MGLVRQRGFHELRDILLVWQGLPGAMPAHGWERRACRNYGPSPIGTCCGRRSSPGASPGSGSSTPRAHCMSTATRLSTGSPRSSASQAGTCADTRTARRFTWPASPTSSAAVTTDREEHEKSAMTGWPPVTAVTCGPALATARAGAALCREVLTKCPATGLVTRHADGAPSTSPGAAGGRWRRLCSGRSPRIRTDLLLAATIPADRRPSAAAQWW